MFRYEELHNGKNRAYSARPWAKDSLSEFSRIISGSDHRRSPITFATASLKRGTQYYALIDRVDDFKSLKDLRQDLDRYIDICNALPKQDEYFPVLFVFVKPHTHKCSVQDYRAMAWRIIQDWANNNHQDWLDNARRDPSKPIWSLCYRSMQLSVNVSCPAHKNGLSRNLGQSLVLVVQPRRNLDIAAGDSPPGDTERQMTWQRLNSDDEISAQSHLGIRKKGGLERRHYAVVGNTQGDENVVVKGDPLRPNPGGGKRFTNTKYFNISVGMSNTNGLGVFSDEFVPEGSLIIESVARRILVSTKSINPTVSQYLFVDPAQYSISKDSADTIVACSEITLLNHSKSPNSKISWEALTPEALRASLVSTRNVQPGEELTIYYTDTESYHDLGPLP